MTVTCIWLCYYLYMPVVFAAIGITNQRETTVAWDKETGEPLSNAIGKNLLYEQVELLEW